MGRRERTLSETREVKRDRQWNDLLQEMLQDSNFAQAYYELEPGFQAAREVIRLRLAHGLTQKELAERVGTHQASISRLERATYQPNLGFLQRVAEALDARVEIRLIPKERTDHAQT